MAAARCDKEGDARDVCRAAAQCLKTGGRLYICYPPARLSYLLSAMTESGLEPKRMRLVHQSLEKEANLALLEGRKGGGSGLSVLPPLIICNADGSKTAEYNAIYRR